MSINISIKIKDKCISETQFENYLENYFCIKFTMKENENLGISYDGYYSQFGFMPIFIEHKKEPYNVYDSEILSTEYKYSQVILFDIDKHGDISKTYNTILNFSLYIFDEIRTDFLITSDSHNEICLIKSSENSVYSRYPHLISVEMINQYNLKLK